MGHHVEFAPAANQPVWDLVVDGQHVQVKEGLAGVKDFLAAHHGIDVYTSPEVAAAVKDPLVHGLSGLSVDQIHEATSQALDGLNDIFDPGFNFPLVTLAFSSWREAKLLWNEKTTFDRAFVNIGMDVAAVGGGAWAGAKGGALAGLFLGPAGAAVGGIIGAIIGGIAGKMASTKIRYAPFNAARAAYNDAIAAAQAEVQTSGSMSRTRLLELQAEYQTEFLASRGQIEQKARLAISRLREGFNDQLFRFAETFPALLDELTAQLEREEQSVLAEIPGRTIRGILFPTQTDHLRAAIQVWFRRARKIVKEEKFLFSKIENRTCETLYGEVQRFLGDYVLKLDAMERELARLMGGFEGAKRQAQSVQQNALREVETERSGLIRKLADEVERIHAELVALIGRWNSTINTRRANLIREARPVGIDR
jgi:hypothetical protein